MRSLSDTAIDYLSRREYSSLELKQKLIAKGFEASDVLNLLEELAQKNLQSDMRFSEMLIRVRISQGKGKILIQQQLQQKGIENADFSQIDFYEIAKETRIRKFGQNPPSNNKDKLKQQRFLQSRGFSFDEIKAVFLFYNTIFKK